MPAIYEDVRPGLGVRSIREIDHHRIHRYAANDRRRLSINENTAAIGQRKRNSVVLAHRNYTDPEVISGYHKGAAITDTVALLE